MSGKWAYDLRFLNDLSVNLSHDLVGILGALAHIADEDSCTDKGGSMREVHRLWILLRSPGRVRTEGRLGPGPPQEPRHVKVLIPPIRRLHGASFRRLLGGSDTRLWGAVAAWRQRTSFMRGAEVRTNPALV